MTEAAMSNKEARLAAFFAADDPPARDPAFVARVAERMEARPLWELGADALTTIIGVLAVLWALTPALVMIVADIAQAIGPGAPFVAAAAIVGGTFWAAMRLNLFAPALEGEPA